MVSIHTSPPQEFKGMCITQYHLIIEDPATKKPRFGITVVDLGASVTEIIYPDKNNIMADVLLQYDKIEDFVGPNHNYLGGTLGRVAHRLTNGNFMVPGEVAGGNFQVSGIIFRARKNDGEHTLNGGVSGFNVKKWESKIESKDTVKMWYDSADGEEGFPGKLHVEVFFSLIQNGPRTAQLVIKFEATPLQKNIATPINLSSNLHMNLAGHETGKDALYKHRFVVHCDEYMEMSEDLCATGKILDVYGTPNDLRDFETFKTRIDASGKNGFDDVFVIENAAAYKHLRMVAYVLDDASGRYVEVSTDHPTLHFSTLNVEGLPLGKRNSTYGRHAGFCFSPMMYPDAPNHNGLPKNSYRHSTVYSYMNCYMFGTIYH